MSRLLEKKVISLTQEIASIRKRVTIADASNVFDKMMLKNSMTRLQWIKKELEEIKKQDAKNRSPVRLVH